MHVSSAEKLRAEKKSLRTYLDVSDRPEHDFANQENTKFAGSCRWQEEREDFETWRDVFDDTLSEIKDSIPQFYYLSAKPGVGKTVLTGHIIAHLQDLDLDCAYYFFHHGNKSGQSLTGLLTSLAYQMACKNAEVRELLHQLREDGVLLDKDDVRSIWRKVFIGGVLQVRSLLEYLPLKLISG